MLLAKEKVFTLTTLSSLPPIPLVPSEQPVTPILAKEKSRPFWLKLHMKLQVILIDFFFFCLAALGDQFKLYIRLFYGG